jgi:glycine/D-amino acid oxidase-like deaminating enzyme
MHRYWIKLDPTGGELGGYGVLMGCGVTADNLGDALPMVGVIVFKGDQTPAVLSATEDVDISTLDPKHILPNIAYPDRVGVWFPSFNYIYTDRSRLGSSVREMHRDRRAPNKDLRELVRVNKALYPGLRKKEPKRLSWLGRLSSRRFSP